MKRTYITPDFNIIGMCESEIIATSIQISKGTVDNSEDIGFVKGNDAQESDDGDFWD